MDIHTTYALWFTHDEGDTFAWDYLVETHCQDGAENRGSVAVAAGWSRGFRRRMMAMATDDDEGGRVEGESSESEGSFDQDSILTRSPHPVLCASYQRTQSWPAAPTEQAFTVKPLGSVLEDEHVFASETFGRRPSESMRRQVRSTERKAPPMSVLSAIAAGARDRSVPLAR